MQALEIGHFGRVAGFHQGLEPRADQLHQAAAKHALLAEQIGLAFLPEAGLDHPRAAAADARGVGQAELVRPARRILVHRQEAGDAAALQIFAAHGMAGPLGRHHQDVDAGPRLDQAEMDVQAMAEQQRRPVSDVGGDLVVVDGLLQLVRRQDHDGVGPARGVGHGLDLQPFGLGLLGGGGVRTKRDGHLLHAGIAQVQGVRVTLRAIAYDRDLLVEQAGEVGVAVVVDAHDLVSGMRKRGGARMARPQARALSTGFLRLRQDGVRLQEGFPEPAQDLR